MENKICVYAISKNESKHVEKWLDSMSEADYIVVLDTGSTDDTVEKLKADSRVTRVEQKIIKPWRFDVARNESMKLVPDDANILVCTDFDEWFEPGWGKILRDNWEENDTRCYYTYAWSHNELGEPQDVFKYDKIHTRDYHWMFPVHEVLTPNNLDDFEEYIFDAGEAIYLHHFQDMSKKRTSYFDLLKLSVKENPNDPHVKMLLAREFLLRKEYDKALKTYQESLNMPEIEEDNFKYVKLESTIRVGDCYSELEDYDNAIIYYHKFIELDQTYREPYFCLAEIYNSKKMFAMAKAMVEIAFKYSIQKFNWIERRDNWIAKGNDILSVSEYYLGNYKEAVSNAAKTYAHNPNDTRIMKNYIAFLEAYKEQLLANKAEDKSEDKSEDKTEDKTDNETK